MNKSIWHTGKEIPDEDRYIVVKNYAGLYSAGSEFEYNIDHVEKWAYFDDLLALETENKDLSDKIGKLETKLERTRKALEIAKDALNEYEDRDSYDCNGDWCGCEHSTAHEALEQITALTKGGDNE